MALIASALKMFERNNSLYRLGSFEALSDWFSDTLGAYDAAPGDQRVGALEAVATHQSIADIDLVCATWSEPAVGTVMEDPNILNISFNLDGLSETLDPDLGLATPGPEQARVTQVRPGVQFISRSRKTVFDFVVPFSLLQERARSYYDIDSGKPLQFAPLLDLSAPNGRAVLSLVQHLCYISAIHTDVEDNRIYLEGVREHVISALLVNLPHNYNNGFTPEVHSAIPAWVRRAEEYMRAHMDEPLTIEALAREAGCSERALQSSFSKFRNKTPMAVLRDMRLARAREELEAGAVSVTDCALKLGFSNLGRFSKLYAEKYGEKPSATLRYGSFRRVRSAA